jgi:hypothetical protein
MKISKGPPLTHRQKALTVSDQNEAQALAMRALAFLAEDMERVERFLALTGVAPDELRALAASRGFQLAVLDHFAGDEALLLQFAQSGNIKPEAVMQARRLLGGGEE